MRTLRVLSLFVVLAPAAMVDVAEAGTDAAAMEAKEAHEEIDAVLAQPQIGLADLFRLAKQTNPSLAMARAGVEAQAGRVKQAGLYPNPEVEVAVEEWLLDEPRFHKPRVELMQPLVIGGRRGAATEAARASLASQSQQLRQAQREALRRVHELWADQLYFREAEATLGELLEVAQGTLDIARVRFDSRAAPESHVTRAMLEVYELEVVQQRLAQDRVRGSAEFVAFFGGVQVPLDRVSGNLDPDHTETALPADPDTVLATHPLLLAARMDVTAAEADLHQAEAERIPDLNVFVAYGGFAAIEQNFVEGGVSIPVPLFHRNQGRVDETRSLITRAHHRARLVENNLTIALATAHQRHQMMHEQLDAVRERIVPAAERGLDQAREAYRVGRLMFLELVDAQRTFAEVRLRTLELMRDLALAEADLLSLLGTGPYADAGVEP